MFKIRFLILRKICSIIFLPNTSVTPFIHQQIEPFLPKRFDFNKFFPVSKKQSPTQSLIEKFQPKCIITKVHGIIALDSVLLQFYLTRFNPVKKYKVYLSQFKTTTLKFSIYSEKMACVSTTSSICCWS